MRILHTSDLHFGRLFHGVHLTDDQAWWTQELLRFVAESKIDAILIAGDVYDRAVPPPEAVALLDELLSRLAVELSVPVVAIAGNHDSPQRLGFGSRLMRARGVHVFGDMAPTPGKVRLGEPSDPLDIFVSPYAEPATARELTGDVELLDHDGVLARATSLAREARSAEVPAIFMAHAFVAGGSECESERPLAVGGTSSVAATHFAGFDYVALGHLHRPQSVGSPSVRYAGSPLKYSFSEASHQKSVTVVETRPGQEPGIESVSLGARHDVRVLKGSLAEILEGPKSGESAEDYVSVALTDKGAILDAMVRIREVWPNCLHLDRSAFLGDPTGELRAAEDHQQRSDLDLFEEFFAEVTGDGLEASERQVVAEAGTVLERRSREG